MADAHRVGIKQSDEALTIGPCRNRGAQGGFETISDQRVRRAPGDPEGVAAAMPEMIEAGTRSEEGQPPNEPDLKRRKPPAQEKANAARVSAGSQAGQLLAIIGMKSRPGPPAGRRSTA